MRVIPMGGCGEFGRNLTAYVVAGQLLIVDCGIQMPDDMTPGVDHIVTDLSELLRQFGPPTAVLLTHGHEDHIGGVGHLLLTVGDAVPIYGRPLTLRLCQRRLGRYRVPRKLLDLRPLVPNQPVWFGLHQAAPGTGSVIERGVLVTPMAVPHSIPEACALLIQGPLAASDVGMAPGSAAPSTLSDEVAGKPGAAPYQPRQPVPGAYAVLHTGDYKLDEMTSSLQSLLASADSVPTRSFPPTAFPPIDMLVGDSTNSQSPGCSGREAEVADALEAVLSNPKTRGRVAVTLFSSHIERIEHFATACARHGRKLCLLGRGLREAVSAAIDCRVLLLPSHIMISQEEAAALPPQQVALLCTGTQGEAVAALGKLVAALAPNGPTSFGELRLTEGDTVVLAARTIPGNERNVGRLVDRLLVAGITVLSGSQFAASGHGYSDELRELLRLTRPRVLLPVHGTLRQIYAHAALAEELGFLALRPRDGDIIQLGPQIQVVGKLATGPVSIEGNTIGEVGLTTLRARRRIAHTGVVAVALRPAGSPLAELATAPSDSSAIEVSIGEGGAAPSRSRFLVSSIGVTDLDEKHQALCTYAEGQAEAALRSYYRQHRPPATLPYPEAAVQAVVAAVRAAFAHRRGVRPSVLSLLGDVVVLSDDPEDAN